MSIDYARMARVRRSQKAALTRALHSHNPDTVRRVVGEAVREWNEIGAWPDDWSRWQRAFDESRSWQHPVIDIAELGREQESRS